MTGWEAGQPSAWTVSHDPVWLDDDRDALLALTLNEQDQCPGCGHPRSESMDPENQGEYEATPLECFACSTAERSTWDWKPEEKRGVYVSTRLPEN